MIGTSCALIVRTIECSNIRLYTAGSVVQISSFLFKHLGVVDMKKLSALILALIAQSAFAQTVTPESTAAQLLDPAKVADIAKDPKAAVAAMTNMMDPGDRHRSDAEVDGPRHLHQNDAGRHVS
jgi:hypothetical protein